MDVILILGLLALGIFLLVRGIKGIKKDLAPRRSKATKAKNVIEQKISVDYNSEATVKCKYIQGIQQLFSNLECQIVANETNVTLHIFDNAKQKIILDYANILSFSLLNELSREYSSIVTQTKFTSLNQSLGIRYISKDGEMDILFSMDSDIPEIADFNQMALSRNNIFDYVNANIEQHTSITL